MKRTTIYFKEEEYRKIREMAFKEGKSMAFIVRERMGFAGQPGYPPEGTRIKVMKGEVGQKNPPEKKLENSFNPVPKK